MENGDGTKNKDERWECNDGFDKWVDLVLHYKSFYINNISISFFLAINLCISHCFVEIKASSILYKTIINHQSL